MPSETSTAGGERPVRLEVRLLGVVEIILDGRRLGAFSSLRLPRGKNMFIVCIALSKKTQQVIRTTFAMVAFGLVSN